jgi:DNA polymerase elongation subunit (family B)
MRYDVLLSKNLETQKIFLDNIFKKRTLIIKEKDAAQLLYLIGNNVGIPLIIKSWGDAFVLQKGEDNGNIVKSIVDLGASKRYVYDLETENHHFHAGLGSMIVHNTDSIFVKLKNNESKTEEEIVATAIEVGKRVGKKITEVINRPPHDLEYEKVFYPFLLMNKKTYRSRKYEYDPEKYKIDSMGDIETRRDKAPIMKTIYGGATTILLEERDVQKAVSFVKEKIEAIVNDEIDLIEFAISKSIKDDASYKNPASQPIIQLVWRMRERDAGSAPQSNERVFYVIIENILPRGGKKVVGENYEHLDYAVKHKMKIDTLHYLKLIQKQVEVLFAGTIDNPKDILEPYIKAEKERVKQIKATLVPIKKEIK